MIVVTLKCKNLSFSGHHKVYRVGDTSKNNNVLELHKFLRKQKHNPLPRPTNSKRDNRLYQCNFSKAPKGDPNLCHFSLSWLTALKENEELQRNCRKSFPLCTGCARRLLAPAICTKIRHLKARQHTASNSFMSAMSTWDKFKWNLGLTGRLSVSKRKLITSGAKLYICCSDFIDFSEFVRVVKLPDTFTAWFLLVNLHLWMVNVKVSQMGKEGEIMKTNMYKGMWNDVERRLNTFKDMTGREKRKSLENYYSDMISSILYYDEGLIGSDKDLANSLWVQLFCMEPNIHVDQLEIMVEYVRKQVYHHDQLDPDFIMKTGYVSFLPLLGEKLNLQKAEQDFKKLCEI